MIARHALRLVEDALSDTPVVLITGPRQCGKSTLAQAASKGRTCVTLDDPDAYALARTDPRAFLRTFPAPLFVDEVQRAPELFLALKAAVDRERHPGAFLLTGSTNVLAIPKIADSLAGRMEVVPLSPLSMAEMRGAPGRALLDFLFEGGRPPEGDSLGHTQTEDLVVRGGFPEPALRPRPERRAAWFQSYVRALLDRDVRDLAQIEGLAHLPRLLQQLAFQIGSPLNLATLAVETGIPYSSLKRYLTLLEKVFLLDPLPAWSFETGRHLAKAPKAYLCDTGLAAHLLRVESGFLARYAGRTHPLLRAFVVQEVRRLAGVHPLRPTAAHLRTVKHLEVDVTLEDGMGRVAGLTVVASSDASLQDAEGLRWLADLAGDRFAGGAVLHLGSEARPLAPNLWALPLSTLGS